MPERRQPSVRSGAPHRRRMGSVVGSRRSALYGEADDGGGGSEGGACGGQRQDCGHQHQHQEHGSAHRRGQARAHRHDGGNQRPQAPRKGDQVAERRRRRARRRARGEVICGQGHDARNASRQIATTEDTEDTEKETYGFDLRVLSALRGGELLTVTRDRVDLDAGALRQLRDLHGGSGRRRAARRREIAAVHVVDRREVGEIGQEDRGANDVRERQAAALQHGAEVVHDAPRLGRDVAADQLTRRRIERNLPGEKQQLAGANRLRVRTDRFGRVGAGDRLSHALGCLRHLARPQAARADPDAPDAAVDHRLDGLKVRLESAGAHVVRVADLPPDDRSLSANLTSFCHEAPCAGASSGARPSCW